MELENYRMAAEIQALEQTILELKGKLENTISKKELQQKINDMDEDDNIWDILCDDYGLTAGKWEEEEEEEEEATRCEVKTDCNYCKACMNCEECECVFCCVCGEVNMTELTDNMEDTCPECSECGDDVVLQLFGEWKKEGKGIVVHFD